jgi:hypothetical protein
MYVKRVSHNSIVYVELEAISRFLNPTYIDSEINNDFFYETAFIDGNLNDLRLDRKASYLKNNAKIIISYLREIPRIEESWIQKQISIYQNNYDIPKEKFIYVYGNHWTNPLPKNITKIYFPYFECDFVHRLKNKEILDTAIKNPKYDILSINGKPHKYMRLRHVIKLWQNGLHKNSIINLLRTEEDIRLFPNRKSYHNLVNDIISFKDFKKFYSWCPEKLDTLNLYGKHHCGYPYDPAWYENTKISLVSETFSGHHECNKDFFVTEKIVRAIGNRHPFVVLSTPHYLQNLRKLGYRTFDQIIDEDYDKILDIDKRIDAAIISVEKYLRIYNADVQKEIDYITQHNYINLLERYDKSIQASRLSLGF